ncbi:MAG TPA: hypothetical protein VGP87_06830 [Gemmatimonadales bacterium]|nr:hypothetical protein [Gemmatimonadales bacterium]
MSSLESLREVLFGDLPIRRWAGSGTAEPWVSFRHAADLIEAGDVATARQQLYSIIGLPHLESRHYLEAWAALRELGEQPRPSVAKHLYGVVLDVPMDHGPDSLAAYADYGCRYLNYSGRATIWEHPNDSLDEPIDRLLAAGRTLVDNIGPWQGSRPPLPAGLARISLLCPAGLHFGQAPFRTLQADPMAAPVLAAGTALLQRLVDLTPGS